MAQSKSRYVPALDGMRALAVLAVIAYHMKMGWAPGGLLGVTMFFVLSGYLITGLLLKEADETGSISLSGFWLRRVRRIIPAVVFSVLGIAVLCTIFDHVLLTKMRPDVVPTLLFFNNWWQILHNVSYFEALGQPSPVTHFWSLAIEEQFYLIWPVALIICMKVGVGKSTMVKGTAVLAVLSALEMAIMFDPTADPSRVYYGTDTRAFSLLIGALLAFVWPYQELTERAGESMSPNGRIIFNVVGVAAVLGLLLMVGLTNGFAPFIYRGGLLLCSLLTAVAIAVLVHPISWISKVFQLPPFVWIGKCSYSMYLWHYPIILLMTPSNLVGDAPIWLRLIQLVVIFGVSAFSYYVVENPIRHGAIGNFMADLRDGAFTLGEWARDHIVPVAIGGVFVLVGIGGLLLVPDASAVQNTAAMQSSDQGREQQGSQGESASGVSSASSASASATSAAEDAYDLLLIGDSVPASLEGYGVFYNVFPYGYVDAVIGRQFYDAPAVYQEYLDSKRLGNVLVIALGTNGYVQDSETEALMKEIGDEQDVWFVNTRSPEEFMDASNAAIQRCVDAHDNAHLIDWYSLSEQYGADIFDGDGTHLTPEGCEIYANMILDAVRDDLPERSKDPAAARAAIAAEEAATTGATSGSATDASAGAEAPASESSTSAQ
ncbi:MAG TPA: acetyltransferase [Eggerthellaceae bacterium]|nr:acetyltransferase [Eggerthellaceae bacterium]